MRNSGMLKTSQFAGGLVSAAFVFLAAALSAASAIIGIVPVIAFLAGLALFILAIAKFDYAVMCWLAITLFIPQWTHVVVAGINLDPATLAAMPVLTGLLVSAVRGRDAAGSQFSYIDPFVLTGIALTIVQFALPSESVQTATAVVLAWLAAYLFGRRSTLVVQQAFVIMMTIIAVWGIVEFASDLHVFEAWYPAMWHDWNAVQERAGYTRSEATLGHAIPYGASLAMAIPFAQRLRFHVAIQIVLFCGVLVSISRGPMFAAIISFGLAALLTARGKLRLRLSVIVPVLGSGYAIFQILSFVSASSEEEFSKSDRARMFQFDTFYGSLQWFTTSLDKVPNETIDSTPLRLAVNFGIVPAVLLLSPVVLAIWNLFTVRDAPASIALVGQIVVLLVISPILQWSVLIFFLMGMVSSERVANKTRASPLCQAGLRHPPPDN